MKEYEKLASECSKAGPYRTNDCIFDVNQAYIAGFLKAREMVDKLCTQHFNELPSSFVRLIEDLGEKEEV